MQEKMTRNSLERVQPTFFLFFKPIRLVATMTAVSQNLEECYRYKNELSIFFGDQNPIRSSEKNRSFHWELNNRERIDMQEFAKTMERGHNEILHSFIV